MYNNINVVSIRENKAEFLCLHWWNATTLFDDQFKILYCLFHYCIIVLMSLHLFFSLFTLLSEIMTRSSLDFMS